MSPSATGFRVRRVYDPPEPDDGVRVLVDRLWPRGLAKARAQVDEWPKELTPSGELRAWLHADPERYDEFEQRYRAELAAAGPDADATLRRLRERARQGRVTLLTAVKEPEHSHVPVLLDRLRR
ncbi:Uncharacterized conserved protein YeaO, DUF488 family [Streptomyces sp. DvalAA-14]|uniref:DUF488 domain-containing protein n=1 Tax=unclassified Streptomyces TaxID=2593676 RepID=UPI00081AFDD0|nr:MULTISPECIES: DUF488 family protein [unclassified Streptomyces]MYS19484.1 DUF488 family protein [Streptomyces sp. SID4948]SCD45623.1 Uncharacterized conserved protein YeaO, DUF488 family [Streptomyces sp. DvalAA-14]